MPPTADLSLVDQLSNRLKAAKTAKQLREIGSAESFKKSVHELKVDEAEQLRALYAELANILRNVCKAEELSGIPIIVKRARPVDTVNGLTYYLQGERMESKQPFECWAPGMSITNANPTGGPAVRFFHRIPLQDFPVTVVMVKGPHPTDSAKTMWEVQRYHESQQQSFIPF